jgi:hypothetical protein
MFMVHTQELSPSLSFCCRVEYKTAVAEDMDYEHMLERDEVAHKSQDMEGNTVQYREVHEVLAHRNS